MDEISATDILVDAIGQFMDGVITVCGEVLDGLISMAPGMDDSLISSSQIWLLGVAIISVGFKIIIEKKMKN